MEEVNRKMASIIAWILLAVCAILGYLAFILLTTWLLHLTDLLFGWGC